MPGTSTSGPRAPDAVATARLALRRATPGDAEAIFTRYSSDPDVATDAWGEHRASARVREKGGFALEGRLRAYAEFPNHKPGDPQDVLCYAILL